MFPDKPLVSASALASQEPAFEQAIWIPDKNS